MPLFPPSNEPDHVSEQPDNATGGEASRPVKIRTTRFGDLEEHELIRLLDTIEDERARSRFRESIYISVFVWMVVLWLALYGPRYLWHAPKVVNPMDVLKERELTQLTNPRLHLPPAPAPKPPMKMDNKT